MIKIYVLAACSSLQRSGLDDHSSQVLNRFNISFRHGYSTPETMDKPLFNF